MNIVLFDEPDIRAALLPLTFTRPVGAIRCGILTIAEKWQQHSKLPVSYLTQPHLQEKYQQLEAGYTFYVNGAICPTPDVVAEVLALGHEQVLYRNGLLVAARKSESINHVEHLLRHEQAAVTESKHDSTVIRRPYDI